MTNMQKERLLSAPVPIIRSAMGLGIAGQKVLPLFDALEEILALQTFFV